MPSTERRLARWRGLTTRPSSDQSPGEKREHGWRILIKKTQLAFLQEAAECSRHLVQEQWVHEDWESGGAGQVLFTEHRSLSTKMLTWLSQDGRNAEKDGGSSFVVSPQQQLYRLHVSSPKFHKDLPVVSTV